LAIGIIEINQTVIVIVYAIGADFLSVNGNRKNSKTSNKFVFIGIGLNPNIDEFIEPC
jgi:hypothetical protein